VLLFLFSLGDLLYRLGGLVYGIGRVLLFGVLLGLGRGGLVELLWIVRDVVEGVMFYDGRGDTFGISGDGDDVPTTEIKG
jgi:hypothetical protein